MGPTLTGRDDVAPVVASRSAGLLGLVGSLVCTVAMTLPAIGVGAAGGMAAMSGASANTQGGFLGFLLEYGPLILLVSVALVTIGLALRRPRAAVPSLAAGAVLYWGMYAQASYLVMYVSLALGFAAWTAIYRWTLSDHQSTGESPAGN
jgi:hypothetical protein